MFSKRNGEPFPAGWWTLALATVILGLVTVVLVLTAIWLLSWQALATSAVLAVLTGVGAFLTFLWADHMS